MTDQQNIPISIHLSLRRLILEKSKRDNIKFTGCQLAQALDMPRSMITKLTHPDATKRVTNPRIDTLMKIIGYFKADGFNITLEDLLGLESKAVSVKNQLLPRTIAKSISVYCLEETTKKLGQVEIKIAPKHKNVVGLCANQDVKPFFKAGSIFIIDPNVELADDTLVAVKLTPSASTTIKKYCLYKNKILLKSLDESEKDITLMPTSSITIMGVVIQVNAKT